MAKRSHNSAKPVTRDADIRQALRGNLSEEFDDATNDLIVEEFSCNSARVDIAVINGALHAFEIKSDSDNLDRLPGQIEAYDGVFDYITLVCGERMLHKARTTIPAWWGLRKAISLNRQIVLKQLRVAKRNPKQDSLALAGMLWKTEALTCLRKHGHKVVTSRNLASEIFEAAATLLSTRLLADEVRLAIKARRGSGSARQSSRDGDLYTTQSTALRCHSMDLSWLLSVPSRSHHG